MHISHARPAVGHTAKPWAHVLFGTSPNVGITIIRVALGLVILPHGAQKLLGWFGGYGPEGTLGYFASLGIPLAFGWLAIITEFFGALALILGFAGRLGAFAIACTMATAVAIQHIHVGFFMNWGGTLHGEGFEYHILAIAMATAIVIKGSGALAIDNRLAQRLAR